jgi:hypothetical protein
MTIDYSKYTIRELLIAYGSIVSAERDYEREDKTFTVHYERLREKEDELLAEAERRDDKPEGLDEQ